MPARIAALLHTVRILLCHGRQLAATAQQRAASTDFNAIAVCFGTGRVYAILAHLQRGILRATALQNVLLARAARGRDIDLGAQRQRAAAPPAAPGDAPAGTLSAPPASPSTGQPSTPPTDASPAQPSHAPATSQPTRRPSRPPGLNDPELFMPTLEELEAQARRRPIGRTLVEICLDLAVVPEFCTGAFWNTLFDSIRLRGGSIATLMQEKVSREKAFANEQDRKVGSNWDWQTMGRDALRRVLGCRIGEAAADAFDPPAAPWAPVAAVATGPP